MSVNGASPIRISSARTAPLMWLAALVFAACTQADGRELAATASNTPDAVAYSAADSVGDDVDIATLPARRALPGTPRQSSAAARSYLRGLNFNWNPRSEHIVDAYFPCHPGEECGGADSIRLRIYPELLAAKANVQAKLRAGSDSGYFLARIQNMDFQRPFGAFGLGPGDEAYLWAGKAESGPPRFAIVRIREGTPITILKVAQVARVCKHDPFARSAARIDSPAHCDQWDSLYGEEQTSMNPSSARLTRAGPDIGVQALFTIVSHDRGIWISCSSGCCQAQEFQ